MSNSLSFVQRLRTPHKPGGTDPSISDGPVWFGLRLAFQVTRQLLHDRATQMAAALTYRTIFSLVPTLLLALVVFRAFGGFQDVYQDARQKIYEYLNLNVIETAMVHEEAGSHPEELTTESSDTLGDTTVAATSSAAGGTTPLTTRPATSDSTRREMKQSVDQLLDNIVNNASNISFKSLGAIGFLLLIWAALGLIVEVENAFNTIYAAPRGRPWHLRITIYWAALTLGPVLVFASLYTTGQLLSMAQQRLGFGGAFFAALFGQFAALIFSWVLLLLLYRLLPNAKIELRAAVIGSLVAAILWEVGKRGFQWYVHRSLGSESANSKLYGSLAMIPLFLLWVYLTWLIVLFGLELTYTLQSMRGGKLPQKGEPDEPPLVDARWLTVVLARIARVFSTGKGISSSDLAMDLNLPARTVADLCRRLDEAGLIHRIDNPSAGAAQYTLSLPAERIELSRLVDLTAKISQPTGASSAVRGTEEWLLLQRLDEASRREVAGATLATLVK